MSFVHQEKGAPHPMVPCMDVWEVLCIPPRIPDEPDPFFYRSGYRCHVRWGGPIFVLGRTTTVVPLGSYLPDIIPVWQNHCLTKRAEKFNGILIPPNPHRRASSTMRTKRKHRYNAPQRLARILIFVWSRPIRYTVIFVLRSRIKNYSRITIVPAYTTMDGLWTIEQHWKTIVSCHSTARLSYRMLPATYRRRVSVSKRDSIPHDKYGSLALNPYHLSYKKDSTYEKNGMICWEQMGLKHPCTRWTCAASQRMIPESSLLNLAEIPAYSLPSSMKKNSFFRTQDCKSYTTVFREMDTVVTWL